MATKDEGFARRTKVSFVFSEVLPLHLQTMSAKEERLEEFFTSFLCKKTNEKALPASDKRGPKGDQQGGDCCGNLEKLENLYMTKFLANRKHPSQGSWRKEKHMDIPSSSSGDHTPIIKREVNLKLANMPSTSIGEQLKESNSEVEDVHDDTTRFLASLSNQVGGGENDASLLKDEDYKFFDGYENDAYDRQTKNQLAFCDAYDIRLGVMLGDRAFLTYGLVLNDIHARLHVDFEVYDGGTLEIEGFTEKMQSGKIKMIQLGMLEPGIAFKNMVFNDSKEYKKIFIASGVCRGLVKVLQRLEFEVEPQEDHTFRVEPQGIVSQVTGSQKVQTHDLIYYHSIRDREQHTTRELFGYREDNNEAAIVAEVEQEYVSFTSY
ncbi:hypothetical protein Tco_0267004 [Tanacetum coccineum]